MKNSYRNRVLCAVALLLCCAAGVSCTQVDDTIGAGLIPGGSEKLTIHVDTLGAGAGERIKAYQIYSDSIGLSTSARRKRGAMNLNVGYFGSAVDPFFGKTVAASVMTALPSQPRTPNLFKNRLSGFDSVKLTLNMKYVAGDISANQTFNIYRLKDSLCTSNDSLYYHSFRYENHIESEPLFSFAYSGMPKEIEEIKLTVLPQGQKMMDELLAADTTLFYFGKSEEFLSRFKGFVIAQAPGTPENSALYVNYIPNTHFNFYFQREREQWEIDLDEESKKKEVTAYLQLYCSDEDKLSTTSIASIRHDFTGTPLDGVQNGERIEAPETVYVQGMGGVAAMLEFPDGFFEAVEALKPSEDYGLYINQAHMYVWLTDQTVEAYEQSFQKLGSYIDYGSLHVIADYFISDSSTGNSVEVPYDGMLNRNPGNGYYKMDITSFLQHALLNADKESRRLTLGPTYTPYELFADRLSALQASESEKPVRVRITYTLIKPVSE